MSPLARVAENVLDRDFEAEQPNQKWVGDATSIATGSGWLYLTAVLDLFSRRVVGWAMGATFDTVLVEQVTITQICGSLKDDYFTNWVNACS